MSSEGRGQTIGATNDPSNIKAPPSIGDDHFSNTVTHRQLQMHCDLKHIFRIFLGPIGVIMRELADGTGVRGA